MKIFDLLSVLGALAWLPFIIQMIISYITKPKLSVITDKNLQIGFTTFGPIINLSLAFLAEKKLALINKIEIELIHETKENHTFIWKWFEETLLEVNIPSQGNVPYKKNQTAIAIAVAENTLTEKRIGFQKQDYLSMSDKLTQDVLEEHNNFKKVSQDTTQIKTTKSYNKLIDHFKNSFNWKVGNYEAVVKVYLTNNGFIAKNVSFSLSNFDVRSLERNIEICNDVLDKIFVPNSELKDKWEWVNIYNAVVN